jgi:hypothetical protein
MRPQFNIELKGCIINDGRQATIEARESIRILLTRQRYISLKNIAPPTIPSQSQTLPVVNPLSLPPESFRTIPYK